jgi:hypothetical protein
VSLQTEIAEFLEAEARLTLSRAPMLPVPQKGEQERAAQMRELAKRVRS